MKSSSLLGFVWDCWKRAAKKIGNLEARGVLVLFYFLVFCPFSLVLGWADPLAIKPTSAKGWQQSPPVEGSHLDWARRQS
jgi:hypothetical protein